MEAVIFDMDGVIVDSERHWGELEEGFIFPEAVDSDAATAAEIAGMNVHDAYDYLADEYGVTVDESTFLDLYQDAAEKLYTEKAEMMDGLPDLLDTLDERGTRLALASSSPPAWIQFVMDRFDLERYFEEIVSGDEIESESKPAPDIYLHTASLLDVSPSACAAVEDSTHGTHAAKAADMHCIGYRTVANEDQDLSEADEVASGSDALRDALLGLTTPA
ncbi:HAD family phosphatase [Halorussus sp. MSC15.2]|uniref:HAD family hydrolase n=1 Tax=Halorussus sp. MSC15.2 TaxID=2283638 RepID=UPI0013D546B1|nr:HAD-IA family hydrolase [Halorussus sp. MSC15.2]NEU59107.1 HAD-IA family hydrolase [Halorussus sp. MSC15.2]